jgi:hypothetical protein
MMSPERHLEINYCSSKQHRMISWMLHWVSSTKCKVSVVLKDASGIIVGSDVSDKALYDSAIIVKHSRQGLGLFPAPFSYLFFFYKSFKHK